MAQPKPRPPLVPSRAHGSWSDEETHALVDAWAPLYERRRRGPSHDDGRVKVHPRGRARCCGALAARDWQHVAGVVNAHRAAKGLRSVRTHEQCKLRVRSLRNRYGKELDGPTEWRFFPVLHAVWAGEVGHRGASAAVDDERSGEVVDDGVAAMAGDQHRGAPVPKRTRTTRGAAVAGAGCREAPVKEAVEQEKNARRRGAPALDGLGATPPAGNARGGAAVDGIAAAVAELLGVALRGGAAADAAVAAGGTSSATDAAVVTALGGVVTKLADVYRHCSLKRMELAMEERVASRAAATGQRPQTTQ